MSKTKGPLMADDVPNTMPASHVLEDENEMFVEDNPEAFKPSYEENPLLAAANEAEEQLKGGEKPEKKEGKKEPESPIKETPSREEEEKEPSDKKPEKELGPEKEEEPKKEEKQTEPKLTKEQEDKIRFHDALMQDQNFRVSVAKKMLEDAGIKIPDQSEKGKIEESLDIDESLREVDPDVVKTIEKIVERKYSSKMKELDDYIAQSKEREKANALRQAKKDYDEFVSENKDLIQKHEKALTETGRKYPDLLRSGKEGLKSLLRLVAHDDIVEQKVRDAVEKALKRTDEVQGNVQKYSHGKATPGHVHKELGIKRGDSFLDVAEATWRDMYSE